MDLPTHMANWTTRLPILSSLTRIPIRPGLTVGGASILVGYSILMAYAGLYKSNLLTDPLRTGYLAVSQIPVVIILATKNNVLGMLLGAAYTRVRIFVPFPAACTGFLSWNFSLSVMCMSVSGWFFISVPPRC
jgi:ferric-chelate reductase